MPDNPAAEFAAGSSGIQAVARSGGTTYIGGTFTGLRTHTGRYAILNTSDGKAVPPFPEAAGGSIHVSTPDGAGGWFIGGTFSSVGGVPRSGIAHILADGTLDPAFDPDAGNGAVNALALSGSELYVGGTFTEIGGLARNRIAKLSATSGNAFSSWNPNSNHIVNTIAVAGSEVYVGGQFTNIGGLARSRIAKLSATSGNAFAAWNPGVGINGNVIAIAVSGSEVYAGGAFTDAGTIGGQARNRIAKLSATSGNAFSAWNPNADGAVGTLAIDASGLYVGGQFTNIGGQPRNRIAKLSTTSGNAFSTWNPGAGTNGDVHKIAASGSAIYVGGAFTDAGMIGGQPRNRLAKLSATSGNAFASFDPNADGTVSTISVSGSEVLAGGSLNSVNPVARNNIAALDANGIPTAWNPNADGTVTTIVADGSAVYAGGSFSNIGGLPRENLAKLSATSGTAFSMFDPAPNNTVFALAVSGSDVYVGGTFSIALGSPTVGGQNRDFIAKLDSTTGAANATWNPDANNIVRALAVSNGDVYAGGDFSGVDSIGGENREHVAKLSATGAGSAIVGWDPVVDGILRALAVSGTSVYLGGEFTTVDGTARTDLAKVSGPSGGLFGSWAPNPDGTRVSALALSGSALYVGGGFDNIGGLGRRNLAVVSTSSGSAFRSFDPDPNDELSGLAADSAGVYAAGAFNEVPDGFQRNSYAQFTGP